MQKTNLKFRVLSALKWLTVARTAGQFGTWIITLIVIRILSPEDYGLVAAVTVVLGFAALTNELGITPALIQSKHIDQTIVRKVFGFLLLSNLVVVGIVLASAPLVAEFFREPDLVPLIRVASAQLILDALGGIPRALLPAQEPAAKAPGHQTLARTAGASCRHGGQPGRTKYDPATSQEA